MAEPPFPLDSNWLREHPLPVPAIGVDKNARGRVLVIGGSALVPGGISLTAEAALRAGAGKVQIATIASAALGLGLAMPEIATIALAENSDGEVDVACCNLAEPMAMADAVVLGPAIGDIGVAGALVEQVIYNKPPVLILDAAALLALPQHQMAVRANVQPVILTPHLGELAALLECETEDIQNDQIAAVCRASERYHAVVMLKGATSFVCTPEDGVFAYAGGGVGLATSGSGDVLAGIVAGLAARGTPPVAALLWAIWLHGEAGRRCAEQMGPIGFLARELLAQVPSLMRGV